MQTDGLARRTLLLFGAEGLLIQLMASVSGICNSLYAANLGASDMQIGLIQMVPQLTAFILLLPAGVMNDRCRSPRTVPLVIITVLAVMYALMGFVPWLGENRISFYFIFLGGTVGITAAYNASWQTFLSRTVTTRSHARVIGFRNIFVYSCGILVPLVCGWMIDTQFDTVGRLNAMQRIYWVCGVAGVMLFAAFAMLPCSTQSVGKTSAFHLSTVKEALGQMIHDPKMRAFLFPLLFLYPAWHLDWSCWFIAEVNYVGLTASHFSYINAACCVVNLISLHFWLRMGEKKSLEHTMVYGTLGLCLAPLAICSGMALSGAGHVNAGVWTFILTDTIVNLLCTTLTISVLQMLLRAVPAKNKGMIISLYTMMVCLSNGVMPVLGVQLYHLFGSSRTGMMLLFAVEFVMRAIAFYVYIRLDRKTKRQKGKIT